MRRAKLVLGLGGWYRDRERILFAVGMTEYDGDDV